MDPTSTLKCKISSLGPIATYNKIRVDKLTYMWQNKDACDHVVWGGGSSDNNLHWLQKDC